MNTADLTKKLIDIKAVHPRKNVSIPSNTNAWEEIYRRSDLTVDKIIFSNDQFTVASLLGGKFVAVWEQHAYVADSMAELREELNHFEKSLLPKE